MTPELAKELTSTLYTADLILKVRALENILISKGICSKEEIEDQIAQSSREILKEILQRANVPGDHDQILNDMETISNLKPGNN